MIRIDLACDRAAVEAALGTNAQQADSVIVRALNFTADASLETIVANVLADGLGVTATTVRQRGRITIERASSIVLSVSLVVPYLALESLVASLEERPEDLADQRSTWQTTAQAQADAVLAENLAREIALVLHGGSDVIAQYARLQRRA